jgi:stearoyl-CoA 9-desaturase NADPH oxidoreductase
MRWFETILTPHGVDRYLELVHPMWTLRELRAVVTDVRHTTDDSVALTLRPTRHWRGFDAGQYVQLTVDIDGVRRTRCYSPSCSQHRTDGRIELTVKARPDGSVSQWLNAHAWRGLVVGLSQAGGSFRLPTPRPPKLLLISGGSGITPVLSMLRTLVDEGYGGEIVFLHYARNEACVEHLADLRQLAGKHANVQLVCSYTRDDRGDLRGHFEEAHLAVTAPWYADAETYACGPPGLARAVQDHYAAKGIETRLHVERFTLRGHLPPDAAATGTVRFGDTIVRNSGATLLEQAEAAGLDPEFGCRMGICFTCPKSKSAGTTRNVLTGEHNHEEGIEVQLCISVPIGDVAIEL